MEEQSVKQYIESQHEEGEKSSSGAFTLSPERAREKMREFQLANPGAYLAKIVQAGVAAGASAIDIKVGRTALTVEFEADDPDVIKPEALLSSVMIIHALPDSPVRHLATGFNAAPEPELAELRWETPRGSVVLTDTGLEAAEHTSERPRFVVRKKLKLLKWFRGTAFVDEIRFLSQRCGYCDCKIELDGRSLRQEPWTNFAPNSRDDIGLGTAVNLLEAGCENPGALPPLIVDWEHYERPGSRPRVAKTSDLSGAPALVPIKLPASHQIKVAVPPSLGGPGSLGLVKHGVLLEIKHLDLGHPSATVLAEANELNTDLSEFQVVEDNVFQAKLESVRKLVRLETEGISKESLEQVLSNVGFRGDRLLRRSATLAHWLQFHETPAPRTFLAHLETCFPFGALEVTPEVSMDKEETVRGIHRAHLPASESIIAIYDDTVLHSAKLGFVITPTRICWKDMFQYPQYILWEHLNLEGVLLEGNKLRIMQTEISFSLTDGIMERLASFVRGVPRLKLKPTHQLTDDSQVVRQLALRYLEKHQGVFYFPYIPVDRVKRAKLSLGKQMTQSEVLLVLYDNTLFGAADNGFALTNKRLYWRNIIDEPHSYTWAELASREITVDGSGVQIGEDKISIFRSELHQPVTQLLHQLAVSLTRSSEPGHASN